MSKKNFSQGLDFKFILRALRYRNYRLFFIGQSISLVGTWMQAVALSWLVYRLTNSALLLGVVGFVGQLPAFLLTPLAGVIADRHNRHRILILTQILSMMQALILAFLVLTNNIEVWHIMGLSLLMGLINSFDMPIRQAFTIEMIENKEDLSNAIALNSSMVNAARLIGPSIAGILIAALGEGICFLINGVSYLAVIASLLLMKIAQKEIKPSFKNVLHDMKEGFVYAFNFLPIRAILLLLSLMSLVGVPYQVLMPIFARDIYHGGPRILGFLMAMAGLGALMGALYLAGRKSVLGLGRVIATTSGLFGLGLILFSSSRILWFSLLMICMAGFAMMVQMAASNIVLQTVVDEDKRGRIMSFYTMAFMGMTPFGSLLAGSLANKIGAPKTLLCGGFCCVLGSLVFIRILPAIRAKIRPLYIKKGIIPEVAQSIEAVTGLENILEK
jgi:MFS family permease